MSHQVHAISRTWDKADIANGIEGAELIEGQAFVHKVDRHEFDCAKSTIDTSNQFIHCSP